MFFVWVLSDKHDTRQKALLFLTATIRPRGDGYKNFLHEVANGSTGPEQMHSAMLRDFKDGRVINNTLYPVIVMMMFFHGRDDPNLTETTLQRRLLWASVSAVHRQLCSGDYTDEYHGDIILMEWTYLKSVLPCAKTSCLTRHLVFQAYEARAQYASRRIRLTVVHADWPALQISDSLHGRGGL